MTEHEQLKEICDKIGYEYYKYKYEIPYNLNIDKVKIDKDVREIIFTPAFIEKLAVYLFELYEEDMKKRDDAIFRLMRNLDNPVQYLHNLLGLGKQ